jgi:hypothetical protein
VSGAVIVYGRGVFFFGAIAIGVVLVVVLVMAGSKVMKRRDED